MYVPRCGLSSTVPLAPARRALPLLLARSYLYLGGHVVARRAGCNEFGICERLMFVVLSSSSLAKRIGGPAAAVAWKSAHRIASLIRE
eukprot:scaffold6942_cov72-Phaeocystis_antarctica.AAC.3